MLRLTLLARQWSSKGTEVRLIDAQQKQLDDGLASIKSLRSNSQAKDSSWGEVKPYTSDRLQQALENVWLVVEVCWSSGLVFVREVEADVNSVCRRNLS